MCSIPIRKIKTICNAHTFQERFFIQYVHDMPMVETLHRHDFFFLLVLEKGSGNHEIDFTAYDVKDYTIFFMKPGQVHQLNLESESKGYFLYFSADSYHINDGSLVQLLNKVSNKNCYQLDKSYFDGIDVLLKSVHEEYISRHKGYEEIIRANLSILFTKLVRDYHEHNKQINEYAQERLEEFLQLLETHIIEKKQVSQYADIMNLSVYQLNKIIKSTLGKTCSEVIREHIILETKRYLLATSYQINQIALSLGYNDVSYFIRLFKKQTGYSPHSFRSNFK